MCGSRKFCQRGSNFDNVFFLLLLADEGVLYTTISRPLSARQRNAKWHNAGVPRMAKHLNAGSVAL